MTVELDRERGPQIRVDQGKEHAAFLNLWKGRMRIHKGRHGGAATNRRSLYVLRGEAANEACLVEVEAAPSSLRPQGVFFLVDHDARALYMWTGSRAPDHKRQTGSGLLEGMFREEQAYARLAARTERQGQESKEFTTSLGGRPTVADVGSAAS